MKRWGSRFFSSTRGHVVLLLRTGEATVTDLADELDLTKNAVRAHLSTLERDGLVVQSGKRPGLRKPELTYRLTETADDLFPQAYDLLFNRLVAVLRRRLPEDELEKLMDEVGDDLAETNVGSSIEHKSLRERAMLAIEILESLGGLAELVETDDGFLIRGFSCPLSKAVQEHPDACSIAEAMLARITGVPVREMCEKDGQPRCRFVFDNQ